MKLSELNTPKKINAIRALREHYNIDFNLNKVGLYEADNMLKKVRTLMTEDKQTVDFDRKLSKHSYMKLVFMEEALSTHIVSLREKHRNTKIVVENKAIDQAQIELAAQDMVDNVQDMIETVSDMLVKELPALVSSMESDVGTNESKQFNDQVAQALKTLQDALMQGKTALEGAVGIATGQGGSGFAPEQEAGDEADIEMGADEMEPMGGEEMPLDMGGEEEPEAEEPEPEEPELPVGRQKR